MRKTASRPAFTLIELLLYLAITSIILIGSLQVMLMVMSTREKTEVLSDVQQELRFAMDRIAMAMQDATDINKGSSTFGTASGMLSLHMSGSLALDPTVFSLSGSRIYLREGSASALPLTSRALLIDELRFTDLSAAGTFGTVRVRLHATDASPEAGKDYEDAMTLETSVSLRQ